MRFCLFIILGYCQQNVYEISDHKISDFFFAKIYPLFIHIQYNAIKYNFNRCKVSDRHLGETEISLNLRSCDKL